MPRLDFQSSGESHGPGLVTIITGMPSGVPIDTAFIDAELRRRQGGFGRGGRQKLETDHAEFLAGVRRGLSTGGPIALMVPNRDSRLDDEKKTPPVHRPRPGHADLAGSVKWLTTDCRDTLERASARETASRVAAGAVARLLLKHFGITTFGFTRSVRGEATDIEVTPENAEDLRALRDASATYCPDEAATERQVAAITEARSLKDTAGGVVECHVFGCFPGLGSSMDWTTKLDARLAAAVMGIQAFKGVEIGAGMAAAGRLGSELHDPIRYDAARRDTAPSLGFVRTSNNAGGLEGGMTNGMPVVVRGAMKPIATVLKGLPSVDLNTKQDARSQYERSDYCAVPAAGVVMEHAVAFEIARAFLDKFGGDSLTELRANVESFLDLARSLPLAPGGERLA